MKHIYIEWVDSHALPGWLTIDEVDAFMKSGTKRIRSTGYLIKEDDEFICITTSNGDGIYCDPIAIPKCAIKKRRYIKE